MHLDLNKQLISNAANTRFLTTNIYEDSDKNYDRAAHPFTSLFMQYCSLGTASLSILAKT